MIDRPEDGPAAVAALRRLGVASKDVEVLAGDGADDRLDLLAADSLVQKAMSAVRFMTMDQQPDFALYLAALRDGRAVVAVHASDGALRGRAVERLKELGAHFLNFYGRVATEEITRWRGDGAAAPGVAPPVGSRRRGGTACRAGCSQRLKVRRAPGMSR